jgi:hypothetical protein
VTLSICELQIKAREHHAHSGAVSVCALLDIESRLTHHSVRNTVIGNAFLRGISGGEV